jgi:hypothetical protein
LLLNNTELTGLLFKPFLFAAKEINNVSMKEGGKKERQKKDSIDRKNETYFKMEIFFRNFEMYIFKEP